MTNLHKLHAFYNVHSHEERNNLKELLEIHLPNEYTSRVIEKLANDGIEVSAGTVRNVKSGKTKNIAVFNVIVEVAKESLAFSKRLKKNLQKAG